MILMMVNESLRRIRCMGIHVSAMSLSLIVLINSSGHDAVSSEGDLMQISNRAYFAFIYVGILKTLSNVINIYMYFIRTQLYFACT